MDEPARTTADNRDETALLRQLRASSELLRLASETSCNEFQLQAKLRESYPAALIREALTLVELRRKASSKFERAGAMWFDRVGLEQSTHEIVARHKAARFHGEVRDLCCGIGADTIALCARGPVIAVDRDPAACLRTQWNVEAHEQIRQLTVICGDVEQLDAGDGLVHIDPDRRAVGRIGRGRSLRLEEGSPGLPFLYRLMEGHRGGAIKVSPAANFLGKFPAAEIELVSLAGECKEATVWFGELAERGRWRATVLPSGESIVGEPLASTADVGPLGEFLFDPDPSLVRSGLLDQFACRSGLERLDAEEEYLTGHVPIASPFVQAFAVLADLPNQDRAIRSYFRTANAGQVEIKCRRIPVDVEAARRKLTLSGDQPLVLIFARVAGRARAVIARRLAV